VAPSEALDVVLYQAMRPASNRRIRMAIKIASNLPAFLVWCKPTWVKNSRNVTFYEFLGCPIYKYLR